jgi:predicted NAD/FAD-binding protein
MTFAVSRDRGAFEWAGDNLATIFCQPSRLLDTGMWRMIYDVLRFNACARRIAQAPVVEEDDMSIGTYLQREGYSERFKDDYLIVSGFQSHSSIPDVCRSP